MSALEVLEMASADAGAARTMKAWVQEGAGSADVLQLREVERPVVNDDRVLIRVKAASVNAMDYHTVHGGTSLGLIGKAMGMAAPPPIRGADVSGVIEAVGKDVTTLRPGDEVFGTGRSTWAEYATGSEKTLVRKPARVSFAEAGAVGIAAVTALQGLRDKGRLGSGQRVLVYGAGGGVGTYAVQIAKALGAHVTAVTGTKNMDLVAELGADVLLDYTWGDIARHGERYDVICDVAATRSIGSLRRLLAPGGMLVCAGAAKRGGMAAIIARLAGATLRSRLLKQRVVFYVAEIRRDDLVFLAELMEAGKIRPAIDRRYPFSEAREALRYTETGMARGKVVITFD